MQKSRTAKCKNIEKHKNENNKTDKVKAADQNANKQ